MIAAARPLPRLVRSGLGWMCHSNGPVKFTSAVATAASPKQAYEKWERQYAAIDEIEHLEADYRRRLAVMRDQLRASQQPRLAPSPFSLWWQRP